MEALLGNLAWPFSNQPALLFVICLPLAITLVIYLQSDSKDSRAAEFVLTLGFWSFLQAAALAYGRPYLGNSSRYMDTLCTFLSRVWAACSFWEIKWNTVGCRGHR